MATTPNEESVKGMLEFGPKKTFVPSVNAPSIYAPSAEWGTYRAEQSFDQMLEAAAQANMAMQADNELLTNVLLSEIENQADINREVTSLLSRYPTTMSNPLDSQEEAPNAGDTTRTGPKHAKEDLINANFNSVGIKAFTDEKGQLVLTNNPAATDAASAMRPFNLPTSSQSTQLANFSTQIRSAKDAAEARGIAEAAVNTIATEKAQLQQSTYDLVSTKLGLPRLRQELDASMARDRADPLYRPGMGDSPGTAKIRTAISQLEDQAYQESQRTLGRNARYTQLDVAAKSIDSEMQRFVRQEDRAANYQDNLRLQQMLKKEAKQEELEEIASAIPAETKNRILSLYPDIGTNENSSVALARQYKTIMTRGDKEIREALNAPDSFLPTMAVRGNRYAADIFVQQEAANSGRSVDAVQEDMKNLQSLMDPAVLRKQMNALIPSTAAGATERRKQTLSDITSLENELKLNNTAEGKARFAEGMANKAISLYRAISAEKYMQDLTGVKTGNQRFNDAVALATSKGGKADFDSVMAAFVGTSSKVEDYKEFKAIMLADAETKQKSFFGAPSELEIRRRVDEASLAGLTAFGKLVEGQRTGVVGQAWQKFLDLPGTGPRAAQNLLGDIERAVYGQRRSLDESQ